MATINNKIEVYPQNTKTIICSVTGMSMTGYTPYLTIKKKTTDIDTILTNIGIVTDSSTLTFVLSSTDTSMNYGDYVYDITIEQDVSKYTIAKDKFVVIDGVRY